MGTKPDATAATPGRTRRTSTNRRMLPVMATARDRPTSLDDWIDAGFALLAEGGTNALRIGRLCDRLHVTKGSFYWHFSDIQAYRAALVEAWGDVRDRERRRFATMQDVPPRQRMRVMMEALVNPSHWAVERVMRTWAIADDEVADKVRQSDRRVLAALQQAFLDEGFPDDEAALRSTIMFSAGVGLLHAADPGQTAPPEVREHFLAFMLRR
ncbi:TetR/AcrR family transcriptional regulator [Mycolicibacterium monacense]|uniref:Transcriptional regulator, TetR family n=1 Tax=Mycobacterium sp. (strain JLS) TaxID=164757 RepID=A0A5Q5CPV5_MYCSJ|nr:TetR family transcriptional regulator [Mycolicibacterium monacense DSM 44395]ORB17500.1 TetR family transcriptional regulator [Mycolicibacterium monacense DSM 44395]QHP88809.1 TetR/AcrR family transcriptional regulator [Mycolicibacterium monacense DSM 44395]